MKKPMQSRAEQRMSKLNLSARKKVHQSGGEKVCISAVTEKSIWNLMCGRKEVPLCSIVLSFFSTYNLFRPALFLCDHTKEVAERLVPLVSTGKDPATNFPEPPNGRFDHDEL